MTTYDVDVLVQSPVTIRVEAESERDATNRALAGMGEDVSGLDYTFGEVVDIRLSRWQDRAGEAGSAWRTFTGEAGSIFAPGLPRAFGPISSGSETAAPGVSGAPRGPAA